MPIVIQNSGQYTPPDGTVGQVLAKRSDDDYDTDWIDHVPIHIGTTAPSNTSSLWIDTN